MLLLVKNIQTQNKLYLFAEEIKKIKVNTFADETLVAISNVLNVGFTEEELSLGSYNYKTGLNSSFSLKNCPKVKKLVLGNNSEIFLFDYTSKLSYSSKSIEIYTNDGKKYNKTTNQFE